MSKITDEVLALAAELTRQPLSPDRWTLGEEVMRPIARELALCAQFPDRALACQILVRIAASAIATLEATAADEAEDAKEAP